MREFIALQKTFIMLHKTFHCKKPSICCTKLHIAKNFNIVHKSSHCKKNQYCAQNFPLQYRCTNCSDAGAHCSAENLQYVEQNFTSQRTFNMLHKTLHCKTLIAVHLKMHQSLCGGSSLICRTESSL